MQITCRHAYSTHGSTSTYTSTIHAWVTIDKKIENPPYHLLTSIVSFPGCKYMHRYFAEKIRWLKEPIGSFVKNTSSLFAEYRYEWDINDHVQVVGQFNPAKRESLKRYVPDIKFYYINFNTREMSK